MRKPQGRSLEAGGRAAGARRRRAALRPATPRGTRAHALPVRYVARSADPAVAYPAGSVGGKGGRWQQLLSGAMAVTYETAEEAYATRQQLWEARQQCVDQSPVSAMDRFMFGKDSTRLYSGAGAVARHYRSTQRSPVSL